MNECYWISANDWVKMNECEWMSANEWVLENECKWIVQMNECKWTSVSEWQQMNECKWIRSKLSLYSHLDLYLSEKTTFKCWDPN